MHYPPLDIGLPCMDRIKLDEADEFRQVIMTSSNVCHIFLVMSIGLFLSRGMELTVHPARQ